jgi:hypothetical protein
MCPTGGVQVNKVRDIEEAIASHAVWMSEMRQAVLDARLGSIEVEDIRAEDRCQFGRWLTGPLLTPEDRETDIYREVRRLHAEFHELAAQIVEKAARGQTVDAYALLYGEYVTMSGRLALSLRAWHERLLNG